MCLQIVKTPAPMAHPPRVLDSETRWLLGLFNQAARDLRQLGYRVVAMHLEPTATQPAGLLIARDREQSIAPLLDRSSGHHWQAGPDGIKRGTASFGYVRVFWEETPCTPA